jgi:membrane associated rhomboid family serine protease
MQAEHPTTDNLLKGIIMALVGVFSLQLLTRLAGYPLLDSLLAARSSSVTSGHIYQLLTYMWLHADVWHLVFNLIGLFFFGRTVIDFLGRLHFLAIYLAGGWFGGILWTACNLGSPVAMVGASGAVLALVTAFATLQPRAEVFIFPLPFPVQARWMALGYAGISAAQLMGNPGSNIAHIAHLGGMVIGWLYVRGYRAGRLGGLPQFLERCQTLFQKKNLPSPLPRKTRPSLAPEWSSRDPDNEFIAREVDPILDKIARSGMGSLTPHERKVLEDARKRL